MVYIFYQKSDKSPSDDSEVLVEKSKVNDFLEIINFFLERQNFSGLGKIVTLGKLTKKKCT